MKKIIILIFIVIALIVGIYMGTGIVKIKPFNKSQSDEYTEHVRQIFDRMDNDINVFLNNKFDKDFFGSNADPFKEMVSQQKALRKAIKNDLQKSMFDDEFNVWSRDKFGIMDVDYQIKQEETTKDKILTVTFSKDYDAKNVTVEIKENLISLEGTVREQLAKENAAEKKAEQIWSYSHFLRQFPVPEKVDAAAAQISREKNRVVIKFPKN